MKNGLLYKLRSGKNSKLAYYVANYLRLVVPKWIFCMMRERKLRTLDSRSDRDYIVSRVDYYNRLSRPVQLPPQATQLAAHKYFSYFCCQNDIITSDSMEKIDQLDRKILQIITQNARMPFKDVAQQCGVSRAAIHQRVQRMIDLGVITGSGYTVNPKMLGYQMCVYIGITLERGSMYKEVVKELERIPEIVESQYTLGAYTILIKLYAKNDEHLMELLNGRIQEIPGVASTETLTSLDQRIRRSLPIEA